MAYPSNTQPTYYIVTTAGEVIDTFIHLEAAEKQARHLAEEKRGQGCVVYRAISRFKSEPNPVVKTTFEESPF